MLLTFGFHIIPWVFWELVLTRVRVGIASERRQKLNCGLIWCSEAREQGCRCSAQPFSFPRAVEKPEEHLHQPQIPLLLLEQEPGLAGSKFMASLGYFAPKLPIPAFPCLLSTGASPAWSDGLSPVEKRLQKWGGLRFLRAG